MILTVRQNAERRRIRRLAVGIGEAVLIALARRETRIDCSERSGVVPGFVDQRIESRERRALFQHREEPGRRRIFPYTVHRAERSVGILLEIFIRRLRPLGVGHLVGVNLPEFVSVVFAVHPDGIDFFPFVIGQEQIELFAIRIICITGTVRGRRILPETIRTLGDLNGLLVTCRIAGERHVIRADIVNRAVYGERDRLLVLPRDGIECVVLSVDLPVHARRRILIVVEVNDGA